MVINVIIIAGILAILIYYLYTNVLCGICNKFISKRDLASNGRIRHRYIGTNIAVCRHCAEKHRDKVE